MNLLDERIKQVQMELAQMGELAKKIIEASLKRYLGAGGSHGEIMEMASKIFRMNDRIENEVVELLVRFQPMASDLRKLRAFLRINYDLFRYCRYALDISEMVEYVIEPEDCKPFYKPISEIAEKTIEMVDITINSIRTLDPELAKSIAELEKKVDELYRKYLEEIPKHPLSITRCVAPNMLTVRHLERIADHAVYISESVIYAATGERVDLSHSSN